MSHILPSKGIGGVRPAEPAWGTTLPTKGKALQRASRSKPPWLITYRQCRAVDRWCCGGEHQACRRLSPSLAGAAPQAALTPLVSESWSRQQLAGYCLSCAGLESSTSSQQVAACILRKFTLFKQKLNIVLVETGPTSICWQLCWYKHSSSSVRDIGNWGTDSAFCYVTAGLLTSALVSGLSRQRTRAKDAGRHQPKEQKRCFTEGMVWKSLPFSTNCSNILAHLGESRTSNHLISWKMR